ncbi:hypothetical protein CPC08DRAFT_637416, partial [Agrocybe pediades]
TCSQLATQYSVSDNNVLASNPFLDVDCNVAANTILCIPQACHTYTIQTNDTCDSVAQAAGGMTGANITSVQLQSFNPELGTYCQLMSLRVGQKICLTPNGGFPNVGATSDANPAATPTSQAPIPTPTVNGTTSNCGRYYKVQDGDICNTVVLANQISLSDFLLLNPEIDEECSNLWLNYNYCVAPYPPFATETAPITSITANFTSATVISYSIPTAGYTPTFATVTLTPAGVPAPTNVATGTRNVAYPNAPPPNVAPGTITDGCTKYYTIASGDTCATIDTKFNITTAQFITMNPEVNSGCTNIALGSAYCVASNSTSSPGNGSIPPNVAAGTITAGCTQYYTVISGDSCSAIDSQFGITLAQFITMNPEVNSGCTNIAVGSTYCVASSNSTSTVPSNVAPGTVTTGCTQYYTVISGDSCSTIESRFGISLSQFITMNPEVNSGCTNIAIGLAYCVASSSSSTVPSNVAAGTITAGCTQYYTVVSGDSCGVIDSRFGITLAQFIAMNPEVNSGCTNIIPGSAYCVASSNTTTPTGPPSNIATGSLTNCTTYYTVASGDNCPAIETRFHIAAPDFFRWNPEVNTACTTIQLGSAYCVAGGGRPCGKVYTVQSGDFCSKITTSQGITQAQLVALNPQLDANCDLNVGDNLCVG